MPDFSERVVAMTQELKALLQQLQWAQCDSNPGDQERILDDLLSMGLIEDLKNAVDHMRYFLWRYIDSAATNPGTDVDYGRQSRRLRQVAETLGRLRCTPASSTAPQSFLEEITAAVNRHCDAGDTRDGSSSRVAAVVPAGQPMDVI
ncbi:MAG TPA: hypothetical protein VN176_03060 [Verrucomicrobiae bacterium]|jgi:hypothetical protein|nr:hypothetical protein [Verrucomicrobiae bacterium]